MNLHAIVAPYVGAVNPPLLVEVRKSVGASTASSGRRTPAYATPGGFTGAISDGGGLNPGTVLTVAAVAAGALQIGQTLADGGIALAPGTLISGQMSGLAGGPGTYAVNKPQLVASEAMTTSLILPAQVQPLTLRDLVQIEGLNLNGEKKAIYVNGALDGVIRVDLKGGDLVTLPNGHVYLVVQNLEGWDLSAGWCKVAAVLQDGA